MKITKIRLGKLSAPLRVPFKTAIRTVDKVEDLVIEIQTDTGHRGYGEAPPTGAITGDTWEAIVGALRGPIQKVLIDREIDELEDLMIDLRKCIVRNTSAKAAADMAIWDLYGQLYGLPVYKIFGGSRKTIVTDITISVNEPEEMAKDAKDAVARGYNCIKVKVGKDAGKDIERLLEIRKAIGKDISIRLDANQGWNPKEAVRILDKMEEMNLNIELVEQPVKAHDLEGMKYVKERSFIPKIGRAHV